jgi:hypothetical protein
VVQQKHLRLGLINRCTNSHHPHPNSSDSPGTSRIQGQACCHIRSCSARSTRATQAAQATYAPGGSIGAEEVSAATARAEATTGIMEEEVDEEVTNATPSAFSLTPERSELLMSLLSAIQSQDPQAAIHLQALMHGTSPPTPTV